MVANEILARLLSWANLVLPESITPYHQPCFKTPRKALLVPSLFIGDNILLTPLIRNLKQNMGTKGQLEMVCPAVCAPLFETNPYIDRIYIEKKAPLLKPTLFLKEQAYDTILMARYSLYWGQAAWRAELPQRIGFDLQRLGLHGLERWGNCLTHHIPSTSLFDHRSQVELYLDMLRHLGLPVTDTQLECHFKLSDRLKPNALLAKLPKQQPRILIHAASGSIGKQWPDESWGNLLNTLKTNWQATFMAIGSPQEHKLYTPWEERFGLYNWCGKTNLRESVYLLSQMDLVITLDTSIAHMAALAKTPRLIVLYGPTNHAQWRPWIASDSFLAQVYLEDLSCRPCMARTCEHKQCMRSLDALQVLQAVHQAFETKPLSQTIRP